MDKFPHSSCRKTRRLCLGPNLIRSRIPESSKNCGGGGERGGRLGLVAFIANTLPPGPMPCAPASHHRTGPSIWTLREGSRPQWSHIGDTPSPLHSFSRALRRSPSFPSRLQGPGRGRELASQVPERQGIQWESSLRPKGAPQGRKEEGTVCPGPGCVTGPTTS